MSAPPEDRPPSPEPVPDESSPDAPQGPQDAPGSPLLADPAQRALPPGQASKALQEPLAAGPELPPDDTVASASSQPPLRAFAQGTGVVLQVVGGILFLCSCCVCSLSGLWDPNLSRGQTLALLRDPDALSADLWDHPAKAGLMLMVMFSTVGGLALAGFGLGLQSDKRHAGWGALFSCLALLLVNLLAGVGLWVGQGGFASRVINLLLIAVLLLLCGFCWAALKQVLANPPPEGLDILPRDYPLPPDHFTGKR